MGKRRFISILSGEVPGTDVTLGRVIDGERQHRPGWDMTFSAPKSVSLEALYRGRRAVMHAHDEAVRATLGWIEQEHLQTRGYDPATGRRPREAADGMVAATFRHMASRNNDPQLDTSKCLIQNWPKDFNWLRCGVSNDGCERSAPMPPRFQRSSPSPLPNGGSGQATRRCALRPICVAGPQNLWLCQIV